MINVITIIIPDSKRAEGPRFNKITARKSRKNPSYTLETIFNLFTSKYSEGHGCFYF